jgi:hypothetical protein
MEQIHSRFLDVNSAHMHAHRALWRYKVADSPGDRTQQTQPFCFQKSPASFNHHLSFSNHALPSTAFRLACHWGGGAESFKLSSLSFFDDRILF